MRASPTSTTMVFVNKTLVVAVAVVLCGCDVYSGEDGADDEVVTVDGGWTLSVNLAECWPTPAPVRVDIDISGDIVVIDTVGVDASAPKMTRGDSEARVEFLAFPVEGRRDMWTVDLADDGELAEALVSWSNGECSVEAVTASVVRYR